MNPPIRKTPAALACAIALAASLAAPAVPWAYASALAYEGDVSDISYVDEDQDGYDDETDEWIGFETGTGSAPDAAGSSQAAPAGSASDGASAGSSSGSSTSSDSKDSGSSSKDAAKDKSDDKDSKEKNKDKDKTSSAFTFAGTGTTVDNATSGDGVEFFTIKTDDDKVYYLVVDRNSGTDNVYLLNTVTGTDLQALAESGKINLGTPVATTPAEEKAEPAEKQEQPQQQGVPEWLAYLIVVAIVGGGAFAYYRLKVKPEREESKVDENAVKSFEDDGIYPSSDFDQYSNWDK